MSHKFIAIAGQKAGINGWIFYNNNNVYFKLVYRFNDNNLCTSYGHGIKSVIYYIFTIILVCGLESLQTV